VKGLRQGFRDARRSIGIGVALAIAAASWLVIALAAVLERPVARAATSVRSEPSLIEAATFGVVLPLASYAFCARLGSTRDGLVAAYWTRHGVDRRRFALGRVAFCASVGSLLMLSSSALALSVSRAVFASSTGSALSLGTVALGALLGALSYSVCFGLAQLIGGNLGRASYLLLDWLLGSGVGVAALPWPRAHLRSLLGGPAVTGMSAAQAALFLVCLTLASAIIYARRVPP
jgi:hypothetical protein